MRSKTVESSYFVSSTSRLSFGKRFLSRNSRLFTLISLILVDQIALLFSGFVAILLWSFVREDIQYDFYQAMIPLFLSFSILFNFFSGVYSIGINPIDELRKVSTSTTLLFLGLATASFWARNVENHSRAAFGLAWVTALILIPVFREVWRSIFVRMSFWGEPVLVLGHGQLSNHINTFLAGNPKLGFRPVEVLPNSEQPVDSSVKMHFYHSYDYLKNWKSYLGSKCTIILVIPETPENLLHEILEGEEFNEFRLIVVPNGNKMTSIAVKPIDFGGVVGLELQRDLTSSRDQLIKRIIDITVVLILLPLLIPLFIFISLAIWIDAPGKVFFAHKRIGFGGKEIKVWKFRTMVMNAEEVLKEYLSKDKQFSEEWLATQKIKTDPRVTRVGRVLRRLSLDELPQIWNVIKGEMSLVGPRPIVTDEICRYNELFSLYKKVKPGITGYWQVSGRNDVDYDIRVELDAYYVRNWSVWFDIYILARTLMAVIRKDGAY